MTKQRIAKKIQKKAMETAMKLMQDERTAPYMAKAMQGFMSSRQKVTEIRSESLKQLNLMSGDEFASLRWRATKIEKRIQQLAGKLDAAGA